jgi:hypothetical protein
LPKARDNNFSLEMHATYKKPMPAMDRTTTKATVLGLFSRFFLLREKIKEMTAKCTSLAPFGCADKPAKKHCWLIFYEKKYYSD